MKEFVLTTVSDTSKVAHVWLLTKQYLFRLAKFYKDTKYNAWLKIDFNFSDRDADFSEIFYEAYSSLLLTSEYSNYIIKVPSGIKYRNTGIDLSTLLEYAKHGNGLYFSGLPLLK